MYTQAYPMHREKEIHHRALELIYFTSELVCTGSIPFEVVSSLFVALMSVDSSLIFVSVGCVDCESTCAFTRQPLILYVLHGID